MPSLALLFFLPFSSQDHLWLSPASSQRPGEPDDAIHMGDGVTGESASWGADREEKGGAGVWRDKQRMSSQVVEGTRAVPGTHCHITNLPRTLAGNNRH